MDDTEVLVIGAGLAGLRCADVLAAAGRDVLIWEAKSAVGGHGLPEVIFLVLIDGPGPGVPPGPQADATPPPQAPPTATAPAPKQPSSSSPPPTSESRSGRRLLGAVAALGDQPERLTVVEGTLEATLNAVAAFSGRH